ncbi:hypothetical protein [Streptomyces sp. NPDC020965]|uniref:hypothetical protein n=1 Tax=Streptomyces sp. NPDC020965 TaxID=3365105 RepID=UPI0037A30FC1
MPAPAAPQRPGIIGEYVLDNGRDYPAYDSGHQSWINPRLVRKVRNGVYFQTVRVPYDTGMNAVRTHPALEQGPVVVNDFARVITLLIPRDTEPEQWNVPGTRFLRPGVTVEIPPATAVRCRDIHWLTPPAAHRPYVVADIVAALTGAPAPAPPPDSRPAGRGRGKGRAAASRRQR